MEPLSPKEIQARVRAGASAEAVAAETGWPLDKVTRYAGPPLAERGYIAIQAQEVEVRRSGSTRAGVGVTLGDTVAQVLSDDDRSPLDIDWDARRRHDGRWIITADFIGSRGPVHASWTYETSGKTLHPIDENARRLMGVSSDVDDKPAVEQAPAPEMVSSLAPEHDDGEGEHRPRLVSVPSLNSAGPAPSGVARAGAARLDTDIVPLNPPAASASTPVPEPRAEPRFEHRRKPDPTTVAIPREEPQAPEPPKSKPKSRRASVPSWDEILFGATRGDDA